MLPKWNSSVLLLAVLVMTFLQLCLGQASVTHFMLRSDNRRKNLVDLECIPVPLIPDIGNLKFWLSSSPDSPLTNDIARRTASNRVTVTIQPGYEGYYSCGLDELRSDPVGPFRGITVYRTI